MCYGDSSTSWTSQQHQNAYLRRTRDPETLRDEHKLLAVQQERNMYAQFTAVYPMDTLPHVLDSLPYTSLLLKGSLHSSWRWFGVSGRNLYAYKGPLL